MGQQIQYNGEPQQHNPQKKIQQLKQDLGIPEETVVAFDDGSGKEVLSDEDKVAHIPDGSEVSTLADSGEIFG